MPNILAFGLGTVAGFFALAFVVVVLYILGATEPED